MCWECDYTIRSVKVSDLFITKNTWDWCQLKYPGHPKGCPNYGKKFGCPPQVPMLNDYFDFNKPMWFVISRFNLKAFADRMRLKHPKWSNKQSRCCLYWQGTVKKRLREGCKKLKWIYPSNTEYNLCPEAMGLNVIRTLKRMGVPIKTKPKDYVFKVAMFGYKKDRLYK